METLLEVHKEKIPWDGKGRPNSKSVQLEVEYIQSYSSEFMGKTFQAAQLAHERFLTIDQSCNFAGVIYGQKSLMC